MGLRRLGPAGDQHPAARIAHFNAEDAASGSRPRGRRAPRAWRRRAVRSLTSVAWTRTASRWSGEAPTDGPVGRVLAPAHRRFLRAIRRARAQLMDSSPQEPADPDSPVRWRAVCKALSRKSCRSCDLPSPSGLPPTPTKPLSRLRARSSSRRRFGRTRRGNDSRGDALPSSRCSVPASTARVGGRRRPRLLVR